MSQPKFQRQHYTALAKDIREELAERIERRNGYSIDKADYGLRKEETAAISAIVNLTLKFARRFEEDNSEFEPLTFLHACSPDNDLYPLTELWEE